MTARDQLPAQSLEASAPGGLAATSKTFMEDGSGEIEPLAARAREGDRAAFSDLVRATQEPLYYAVLRLVANPQDARDVVQKTYLRAWSRSSDLKEAGRWRSWLFSIGLNLARNHLRDSGRHRFDAVNDTSATVPADAHTRLSAHEERARLREALEHLPPRQREVVSLRIDGELSFKEIASALECSQGSARVNFHHGMVRLREMLLLSKDEGAKRLP